MIDAKTGAGERLVLRRTYDAPLGRVWAAWQPDELARWHAPEGMTVSEFKSDMRVGGPLALTMIDAETGEKTSARGVYREIFPLARLKYTWTWEEDTREEEHETLLTIDFRDLGGKTEVTLTHEQLRSVESRDRHTDGWNQCLDKLALYLSGASAA